MESLPLFFWRLEMYSFIEYVGGWYVIHNSSGCSIPYSSKTNHSGDIPEYKREHFYTWVSLSRNAKKRMKTNYMETLNAPKALPNVCDVPLAYCNSWQDYDWQVTDSLDVFRYAPKKKKENLPARSFNDYSLTDVITLDALKQASNKPKENTMAYNNNHATVALSVDTNNTSADKASKDYLEMRAYRVFNNKDTELQRKFGIEGDPYPSTATEMIDRIKAGKFVIEDDDYGPDCILWRDPAIAKDRPGYTAARKILDEMFQATKDEVLIKTPIDGLAALRAFESATIQ